jgi:protein-S-isoprenylcysteine O-methyltransferase Ste14
VIALLAIPIMIWSIVDEEKILVKQYGESYLNYMKMVPWRMIPKIF